MLGLFTPSCTSQVADAAWEVLGMIARGELPTDAISILPLEQVAVAHKRLEQRLTTGKLILRVGN